MVGALFDTNILIDQRNTVPLAREEIARFEDRTISIIWMEVMVGADAELIEPTRPVLDCFKLIALNDESTNRAVALRRAHRIKLPDAKPSGRLLVTRNAKGFQRTARK